MFTAKPQKNRAAATQYFDEHLAYNDYYTVDEMRAGHWIGQGAERLGLMNHATVSRETFLRLCDNLHPDMDLKLTPMQLANRRIFFDFTCSAPKSVSILAVTMDDKRLIEAHRQAATLALRELETYAGARVRKDGAMDDRTTGNVVSAAFLHTSSRALDPQLHTHFTVFNVTYDATEARWKALQTEKMFAAIRYGTAVYRNELAKRLHDLGYETRAAKHGFEITGVDQKLLERFSKRAQQRNAAVARKEQLLGRKLSNDEISHVVHQTRPGKRKDVSDEKVRAAQRSELNFFEKRALKKLVAGAQGERKEVASRIDEKEACRYAVAHVFARQSVAPEYRLLETALAHGCGQLDLAAVKRTFAEDSEMLKVGAELSTRTILRAELSLIRTVNTGLNAVAPLAAGHVVSKGLGEDQRVALTQVLSSPDRITGFRGRAGTGKSTALRELNHAVKAEGYEAVFCAPTAVATDGLRKEGFEAVTLAKLLADDTRPLGARSVIVLDEAGAVGTMDMKTLFERVVKAGGRVVLVGDTAQHASVAQGDALRIIEEHSGYRHGELTKIWRQKCEVLKEIVTLAGNGQSGEALQRLQARGEVIEAAVSESLYREAAAAYVKVTQAGKSALVVSPTWAEIEAVTAEVRTQLKQTGAVSGNEETLRVFDSLGWTEAQKGVAKHYEPGWQLRFVRPTKQFKAGETVEVVKVQKKSLIVRCADGRTQTLEPEHKPAAFDVGQKRELPVASGDWLLLQANAGGFLNGERVQVKSVQGKAITLADGRALPAEYRAFTHGYAVTSHSAQSKTVDEVLVVASSRSFAAVSSEQFYVSISRARERARVYTDDAERLAREVADTHTRKAVLELEGLRAALAAQGFARRQAKAERLETVSDKTRVERPMRAMRAVKATRLEPRHLLAQWAQAFKQRLGLLRNQQESARLAQAIAARPNVTARIHEHQRMSQRQSRGIRM